MVNNTFVKKGSKTDMVLKALKGFGASTQYMTTGKMPEWAPNPPNVMRRLSYLGSDQTGRDSPSLGRMADKEYREHPWLSYDQARRLASDHLREHTRRKR